MKFEEALTALREGAKIWHPTFSDDEYLAACRVGFIGDNDTPLEEKPISIVRMKGDRQADDMAGVLNYVAKIKRQLKKILTEEDYKKYHNMYTEMDIADIFDKDIFKFPHLNLFLIMSDEWKILGGIK
jgi:hypothetical protein